MLYQIVFIFNIVSAVAGASVSIIFWHWCFIRWKENSANVQSTMTDDGPVVLFEKPIKEVTLQDLISATRNFAPSNLLSLGRAWVGPSYKAILADGSELIVQCLRSCVLSEHAFRLEMGQIDMIRHPNLVPLLGFAILKNKQRFLLYKYMRNGTLSRRLSSDPASLNWHTRLRIAIGAARGLAWLHHGLEIPLVHGHFSSNSILLDDFYEARITDSVLSGLAIACPIMRECCDEEVYAAPECNRLSTTKGDVYAFGVVMLELVTGKEAVVEATDEADWCKLVDRVSHLNAAGCAVDCIDQSLRGKGYDAEILRFFMLALSCVAVHSEERLPMHRLYHSIIDIAGPNYRLEYFDEFPLIYRLHE
ncbi:hypothetical protein LUZ63_017051 [Rhynchospora breviuscula]|uniref:Protein kinase domain-containing protein n=1 Tax=Rhynchospora breviuscula TaxID=2022672 RepID=A0A9Q0HET8_9POAL|nr:hypothetical protein LUZ63_017051 [Rhynchospora breviuscula]